MTDTDMITKTIEHLIEQGDAKVLPAVNDMLDALTNLSVKQSYEAMALLTKVYALNSFHQRVRSNRTKKETAHG